MHERETRIRTAAGEMTTFVAHPDGPFPVAVLYMDGDGYRRESEAERASFRTPLPRCRTSS